MFAHLERESDGEKCVKRKLDVNHEIVRKVLLELLLNYNVKLKTGKTKLFSKKLKEALGFLQYS
jgi:hypothetical protein